MRVTVTFYKKKHERGAEIFAGTYTRPGDTPSEWQKLQEKIELKQNDIKFILIEYENKNDLPGGYADKINRPIYIDLLFGEQSSGNLSYPKGSILESGHISTWILQNRNARIKAASNGSSSNVATSSTSSRSLSKGISSRSVSVSTHNEVDSNVEIVEHKPENFASSWRLPVTIVGIVAAGVATIAAVTIASEIDEQEETEPIFFVNNKGDKVVDFREMRWEDEKGENPFQNDDEEALL
tara:strand:- start:1276 stop:1992 length:717 start_codon:yes stop_codon:yes gene_type:complete